MTLLTEIAPRCAEEPSVRLPILFKAAFTVAICVPLLIEKFVPAPVTALDVFAPTVTAPLALASARVPVPERVISPFKEIEPEPVVIFPAFHTSGPLMVNDAFVPLANDKS